jgi:conjugative relaxase-like TrwC/TraI family protein
MLNIGRMGAGSQRYYLDHVARSTHDYYLGRGEAPGRWLGNGLSAVGLAAGDEVTAAQLAAILAADHPSTSVRLSANPARSVPGFDLTFRAPKSVSLLWGLTDHTTMTTVEDAHHAAVAAAVGYLERTAGRSRRGKGGCDTVSIEGFVAAGFDHRTSRDGDPLLHTHVLVANLARTRDDGRWRTIDSRRLYKHARTAGSVYQAVLRHELTARLGVAWQPVSNSTADLAGVPRSWIEGFSKRRAAIVAEMDRRGEHSPAAAQVATLDTRKAKPTLPDTQTLQDRWRTEATTLGVRDGWWRALLHRTGPEEVDLLAIHRRLVTDEGLTQDRSTFTTRDLVRHVADALPAGGTPDQIGRAVSTIIALGRDSGRLVPVDGNGYDRRWTTRPLLELTQRTVDHARQDRSAGLSIAHLGGVGAAVEARPTLALEQGLMVEALTTGGDGVSVVVGMAGTGKTFALDAARHAWQDSGITVTGTALAARAAVELEDASGIQTDTLARLLRQLDNREPVWEQGRHVLVVDEAGMVGTRQLARLLAHAREQQVKVVLVGDPRQLPEIEAGGLYSSLVEELGATTLDTNRRQTHRWEAEALDQLRHGDVHAAVDAYRQHGRIISADSADALRERLVGDWWHHTRTEGGDTIMIALRRTDVTDLNMRARTRLAGVGELWGPERLLPDDTVVQAGDQIVCLRNDRRLGVVNGTRATVTWVGDDGSIVIEHTRGLARIPAAYVDAGHLTHGYAITGHKAQGLTVDATFVLGSDALYREWGYVAMSRGRHTNRLYVHANSDSCHHVAARGPNAPVTEAARHLQRELAEVPIARQQTRAMRR